MDRRHTGISLCELYQAREPGYSIPVLQKGASIAPICHPACVSTGAIASGLCHHLPRPQEGVQPHL